MDNQEILRIETDKVDYPALIMYRVFSIKHQGCLLKTQPRRPGVYIRGPRLLIECVFQYWKFIEPRTKFQQKRLKNVKQCHQLCLI